VHAGTRTRKYGKPYELICGVSRGDTENATNSRSIRGFVFSLALTEYSPNSRYTSSIRIKKYRPERRLTCRTPCITILLPTERCKWLAGNMKTDERVSGKEREETNRAGSTKTIRVRPEFADNFINCSTYLRRFVPKK